MVRSRSLRERAENAMGKIFGSKIPLRKIQSCAKKAFSRNEKLRGKATWYRQQPIRRYKSVPKTEMDGGEDALDSGCGFLADKLPVQMWVGSVLACAGQANVGNFPTQKQPEQR